MKDEHWPNRTAIAKMVGESGCPDEYSKMDVVSRTISKVRANPVIQVAIALSETSSNQRLVNFIAK
jgi:hypothetical protein